MGMISTVTGPIGGDELGFTLAHEHAWCSSAGILGAWPELAGGRERILADIVAVLRQARADGIETIVDATTFDLGRDAGLLVEASRASGMRIIAATGLWLDPGVTMRSRSTERLTDLFVRDLTEGIDGTPARAGVIKVANEESISPADERILVAAARASVTTGAPILTHTAARHRTGEKQAAILEANGVDPARVCIGHSDDSTDIEYLVGLVDRGYWLGLDRLPNGRLAEYGPQSVDDRIDMMVRLIERGHGGRLLLAHDDPIVCPLLTDEDQARHQRSNPDSIMFVSRVVLPALRDRGIPPEMITTLMVDNPRRWLTGA